MVLLKSCLALAAFAALAAPASAQEINPLVRERIGVPATIDSRSPQARVQTNVNLFMPGPSGEGDAANQLRDRARRAIYELASRECGLVLDVLAQTCRLEAINVNINRQMAMGTGEGYMVSGNITMVITPK